MRLKLVAGATVQERKYAVAHGLPDRYVVSLMNGVRLRALIRIPQ